MDWATSLGLFLAVFSLGIAVIIEGGHLSSLLSLPAFIIVIGGTIGVTIIGFTVQELKNVPTLIKISFMGKDSDPTEMIQVLVRFAEKARREGLLALEDELSSVGNEFVRKGMQLVIDGTDAELVRNILETELNFIQDRHHKGAAILEAAGGYAPTMGIVGTVMGLVHVLGNLNDTENLGPAIAVAFIATLYGIASANVLFLPLAGKLKNRSANEILVYEVALEGILSVQSGDNPRIVEEKLKAFLAPSLRGSTRQPGKGE